MPSRVIPTAAMFATAIFTATAVFGDFSGSYLVPLDHRAIQYSIAPERTRVTTLQRRLQSGEASLAYSPEHGYLEAVLTELRVPVSSQVLVFSKTSFQAPRIAPRTPRALYHSDDTYVGYVQGGDVIEIAAVDPQLGVIFYTLDQEKTAKPQIARRGDCLQCHAGNSTIGIPGLMVRSMHVERSGMPIFNAPSYVTDHRSPLGERWGGWYVTGTHGKQLHMGNVFVEDRDHPELLDRRRGANLTDLNSRVDTHPYLAESSDIVSLLVLEHKTRMTNLITRAGFEVRMALHDQRPLNEMEGAEPDHIRESTARRIRNAAEELLRYMLFIDEAPLESPVEGWARYAKDFTSEGPRDSRGRSLRDLDLQHRLLRYPCSFLIYSEAFDGLPGAARDQIYRRLYEILSGKDQSREFAGLSASDRRAVLEILRETKNGLPDYFRVDAAVPTRP
jgi:hypothetical protein